jgi:hypothetical protein
VLGSDFMFIEENEHCQLLFLLLVYVPIRFHSDSQISVASKLL